MLPHPPKSLVSVCTDGAGAGAGVVAGFVTVGSGEAHALFEPHASMVERLEKSVKLAVGGFGAAAGAEGLERLKADATFGAAV